MMVREDYVNQHAIAGWIRDLALLAHDRRMRAVPLDRAASGTGMETKAQHSPVDKWSLAVKLRPDGDGEQGVQAMVRIEPDGAGGLRGMETQGLMGLPA